MNSRKRLKSKLAVAVLVIAYGLFKAYVMMTPGTADDATLAAITETLEKLYCPVVK